MQVSEMYRPNMLTCRASDDLRAVAQKMTDENVSALAVVDGQHIVGIISERDLTRALAAQADASTATAAQYASAQVEVAALNDDTYRVAKRMLDAGVRHLPVVDDREVVGMVSMRDILAIETWG